MNKEFLSVYKDGNCIADHVENGNTFFKRFKGLMWRKHLCKDGGFYLDPCNSIHTFMMRFTIDVLFLSKEGIVLEIKHEMLPWRIKPHVKGAKSTLELAAKMARQHMIIIGDQLIIKKT